MSRIFPFLFIVYILQLIYATSILPSTVTSTPSDHVTTPVPDVQIWHSLYFYYSPWGLEHLMLVYSFNDCFLMPLSEKDVKTIQDPQELRLMEEHMVYQIGQHNFITWTYDDFEVRDKAWSDNCKKKNGTIYRVYRL